MYYTEIFPNLGIYDLYELKIRTVKDNWFVGVDMHSRRAYLLYDYCIDDTVFFERGIAVEKIHKAEELFPRRKFTIQYEEN